MQWFEVEYYNLSDSTKNVTECIVVKIEPWEDAYTCMRLFDGRSYEDCLSLTFDDVMELKNELFNNEHWYQTSVTGQLYNESGEKYDAFSEGFVLGGTYVNPKFSHTGYDVKLWTRYSFLIDPASGEVRGMDFFYGDFKYE